MYRLTPPTATYKAGPDGTFWGRVSNQTGLAVVIYDDGRVVTLQQAPSSGDEGVVKVWPGGRTYDITDTEAETLIEAGYSANVAVVA